MLAALVRADVPGDVLLPVALEHHGAAADRTAVVHGHVPGGEVALRVPLAAVEHAPALGVAHEDRAAALGAVRVDRADDGHGVAAGREVRAGQELAEPPHLVDHHGAALVALDVRDLVLDLDLLDDYSIYLPTMSVHLDEIVIVKPKAGKEAEVQAELDEHFAYIKDGAAFYPDQEIAAAGAVEGKTDDGFYYIIVNQIGSQIEEIIKDYKPGDEVPKLEVPEVDNEVTVPTDELGSVVFPSMTTESVMPGDGVELG